MQNTLKDVALPVHLLRQVPLECFFGSFFASFSRRRFCIVFESMLEGLWEGLGSQNEAKIDATSSQNQPQQHLESPRAPQAPSGAPESDPGGDQGGPRSPPGAPRERPGGSQGPPGGPPERPETPQGRPKDALRPLKSSQNRLRAASAPKFIQKARPNSFSV